GRSFGSSAFSRRFVGREEADALAAAGGRGGSQGTASLSFAAAPGESLRRQAGAAAVPALSVPGGRDRLSDAAVWGAPGRRDGFGKDRAKHPGPAFAVSGRSHPAGAVGLPQAAGA